MVTPEQKVCEMKEQKVCETKAKTEFEKTREVLSLNLKAIKTITLLRDENKKIEKSVARQLKRLDKERNELIEEQKYQEKQYEKCKIQLDMRVSAIQNAIQDCSEDTMVSLNIGGKVFQTLKSTVSNISPFFACLFSDKWGDKKRKTIRDKDGNIFIDRSSQYFEYLLDWSRNGGSRNDLIDIVLSISDPNRTDASKKLNIKTFMKTMEYYGIDYETYDQELNVDKIVDVYWRGDKKTYNGTVKKLYFDEEEKELCIIINYADGTRWKYNVDQFDKTRGPYSQEQEHNSHRRGKKTKWWHYGVDKGGIKLNCIESLNPIPSMCSHVWG